MCIGKRSLIGLVIITVVLVFYPVFKSYLDRGRLSPILAYASQYKTQIAEFISVNGVSAEMKTSYFWGKLQVGPLEDDSLVYINHFEITKHGQIVVKTTGIESHLEVTPVVEKMGQIRWHCFGQPRILFPENCRGARLEQRSGGSKIKL